MIEIIENIEIGGKIIQKLSLNGELVFIANQIAKSLGYKSYAHAINRHCEKQFTVEYKDAITNHRLEINNIEYLTKEYGITLIYETDLLALISKSKRATQQLKNEIVTGLGLLGKVVITENRKELEFRDKLKKALEGFGLSTLFQHRIGKYFADVCIPEKNIIVEYDESGHSNYCPIAEQKRTQYIESKGYAIVRVTDSSSDEYNIGKVFKAIFDFM